MPYNRLGISPRCARTSMMVGPMVLVLKSARPRPMMPSIGYERNSEDTLVAIPNVNGTLKPAKCASSDATTPLTWPVP